MSGGGGDTKTTTQPWAGAQPYLLDVMRGAQQNYQSGGPQYYPGQTFVGPTPGQIGGWDAQLNYADQVFGGQNTPKFGQASDALGSALAGNTQLGSMANQIGPISTGAIQGAFGNPFGTAGGLDARGAIQQQLSGQPNYDAVHGAIDAANTQQWNQLYNQVIPQLNQRASFLGNPSGAIKDLNSAVAQIGQNQNLNAQQAYLGQLNLAQQQQANAANLVSQGGLSTQTNALGLGGLAGNLAQGVGAQSLQGVGLFPQMVGTGQLPGQIAGQFGDWGANFQNQALQDQLNRYNYYQNLPNQNLQNYAGLVNGFAGLGSQTTAMGAGPNRAAGALGGAATGAAIGSVVPVIGTGIGALAGAALGYYSDRRLKEDVTRIGELPSGLGVYRYRFYGDKDYSVGVMADEVRKVFPEAVSRDPNGFDRVNYGALS